MIHLERLRKRKLVGLALSLVLVLAVASVVLTAPVAAARSTKARDSQTARSAQDRDDQNAPSAPDRDDRSQRMASPFQKGMVFTITGSGKAFKIHDRDDTKDATLSLTVKVIAVSPGRAKLNVTSGTLTIGSGTSKQTFTVKAGHGIINTHSMKVILHIRVEEAKGKVLHLILFGHIKLQSTPLSQGFTVDFTKPQSKLAGKWFLMFQGAKVSRVS